MSRAIQLAWRGQYTCEPNPRVGCVIARDGGIIAEGWHGFAGREHAEINAINACEDVSGATVYVNLEPCTHQGKTPPCADALIRSGVSEVVIAMPDPNPVVFEAGMTKLQEAGIVVRRGLLEESARRLNPGFIKRMTAGRPYTRCKLAISLDGRTALSNGLSQWISGEHSRRDVHRLRAASGAILSSVQTVIKDDPALTSREMPFKFKSPARVILDRTLGIPPRAKLFETPGQVIIYTQSADVSAIQKIRDLGAELVTLPDSENYLRDVLRSLAETFEINDIMIEAGTTLSGAFIKAGLVDELIVYVAPGLMGHHAAPMFHLPRFETLKDVIKLEPLDIRQIGKDMRFRYEPGKCSPE